ncbi:adenosine receptor A2a-like [Oculina patagonica]
MEKLLNSIGWLLSIATVAGNSFVVFLVAKNCRLHSSANWFVLSLAVADFGVGIAVFPLVYIHSSVTNLCVLTLDRYIAIVHPFKYNTCVTKRQPGVVISAAWLIAFAFALSLLVGMYATNSNTALKFLRLIGVSAFDIISCVLLFYAVVRILVVARAQSRQEAAMELQVQSNQFSTEASNVRRHRKHNTAFFIITLVLFFLGCYIVVSCLVLCITFSCKLSDKAGQIVSLLLVLNSAVNPLVYAFLKSDIKWEIKKLIARENGRAHTIEM